MKDFFESNERKSTTQTEAEDICKALGITNAKPVLVDAKHSAPFWINNILVLVKSDHTTQAEVDAIHDAIAKKAEVFLVTYDPTHKKILNKTTYDAIDLEGISMTPGLDIEDALEDAEEDSKNVFDIDIDDPEFDGLSASEKNDILDELEEMRKVFGGIMVVSPTTGIAKPMSKLTKKEMEAIVNSGSKTAYRQVRADKNVDHWFGGGDCGLVHSSDCGSSSSSGCGSSSSSGCGSSYSYSSGCGSSSSSGCGSSSDYYSGGCGGSSGSHC